MRRNRRNKTFRDYHKILQEDRDWDYGYLLILEQKKLQTMIPYFEGYDETFIVRDLKLCVRLLDIIQGADRVYLDWSEECQKDTPPVITAADVMKEIGGETEWLRTPTDFPRYINVRNFGRFQQTPLPVLDGTNDTLFKYMMDKVELRREKAFHLYHLIRMYRMRTWWY